MIRIKYNMKRGRDRTTVLYLLFRATSANTREKALQLFVEIFLCMISTCQVQKKNGKKEVACDAKNQSPYSAADVAPYF